jgi:tetratricopeptide (TPR) repeat protein
MNRRAEGLPILESVAAGTDEAAATAKVRLASLASVDGRRADAYRLIDEALQKQPKHQVALIAKAEMLLQDRKIDEAFQTASSASDTNPLKHLLLGRIYGARREWREAMAALNEALRLNPRLAPAQLELGRIQLVTGNADGALQTAQAVSKAYPGSSDAKIILARAYMAKGDAGNAEEALRPLKAIGAKSAAIQAHLGLLELLKKNPTEARAAFERALELDANQPDALAGVTTLDLQTGNVAAARARVERRLAAHPRDPDALMFAARIYFAIRDFPASERVLRQVIDLDPSRLSAYAQLGQVYALQQKMDEARAEFELLSAKSPKLIAPPTLVGMIYQSQNKTTEAKAWYEKALAIDQKEAAVAANNLAWLTAETGGSLDVSLQLAQNAKATLPDVPEVDDTLGWIYYKKGLATMAIRSFESSVEKDPKNATYHYHLGLAYASNKEPDKARKSIEQALSLKLSPEDSSAAQRALASLKS